MNLDAGIHDNIPPEDYHADRLRDELTLSRSGIHMILNGTMADFAANNPRLRNPSWPPLKDDSTDATTLGEVIHSMVLGVGVKWVASHPSEHGTVTSGKNKGKPYSSWTGAAKEWKDEQGANGIVVLDYDTADLCRMLARKMTDAIVERYDAVEWSNRRVEQTIIWQRTLNDGSVIWCRARPDVDLPCGVILDLKSTALSLSDQELGKRIAADGIDIQHCWYQDGLTVVESQPLDGSAHEAKPPFTFVYIQTVAPYSVRFVDLDAIGWPLHLTRMRIDLACHKFGDCLKSGVWPDHPIDANPVPPPWAVSAWERQLGIDGEIEA